MSNIAERIKSRRKHLKLSQEELAGIATIDQTQISRYEVGKNEPGADVLAALATALDTTTDWLLGLTENPARPISSRSELSDDEREMLEIYRQIDPDKRRQMKNVARAL